MPVQIEVPKPLVGFVIGRNGEHINNIQNTCGVRLQFQNGKGLNPDLAVAYAVWMFTTQILVQTTG